MKIIFTARVLLTFNDSFTIFSIATEIQDGCQDHMTTPFHKKLQKGFFLYLAISVIYAMQVKKSMIKLFTAWVSDLVKFP
jgi:hypothetical protein